MGVRGKKRVCVLSPDHLSDTGQITSRLAFVSIEE